MVSYYGCTNEFPPDITSLSHIMSISFSASDLKEREGFVLNYQMVYDNGKFSLELCLFLEKLLESFCF